MRLSELKSGESGVILKVRGHGGFRRRIMEMGFVRGKRVEVILNAPLQDPIEYKIVPQLLGPCAVEPARHSQRSLCAAVRSLHSSNK